MVKTKWISNTFETEWKLVSLDEKDVYAELKCLMVADEDDIWRADNGHIFKSLEEAKKRCEKTRVEIHGRPQQPINRKPESHH